MKSISTPLDLKRDFPALAQQVSGRAVAYLDSAASAQKPQCVIDAMNKVMTSITPTCTAASIISA